MSLLLNSSKKDLNAAYPQNTVSEYHNIVVLSPSKYFVYCQCYTHKMPCLLQAEGAFCKTKQKL